MSLLVLSCPLILFCQPSEDASNQLWMAIKKQLSGSDGDGFFEEKIKNCLIPTFYGTVVSRSPEDDPRSLMVVMHGSKNAEIRLQTIPRIEKPLQAGSSIAFEGIAVSFTREPFLLTLKVTSISRYSRGAETSKPRK